MPKKWSKPNNKSVGNRSSRIITNPSVKLPKDIIAKYKRSFLWVKGKNSSSLC